MVDQPQWWYVPIVQGIFQLITWFIVISGWFIVNRQNNDREFRKETRVTVDKLKERLEKLEQKAITFHCEVFDLSRSKDIVHEIQRISQILSRLDILSGEESTEVIKKFRQSITLKNFDQSSHNQLSIDNPILENIYRATNEIIDSVEESFSCKFKR